MVFTTTNLFKGIARPQGDDCRLTSCIFSHDDSKATREDAQLEEEPLEQPAPKRRKITYEDHSGKHLSKSDQIREQLASERQNTSVPAFTSLTPPSLSKPVSPPPMNGNKQQTKATSHDQNGLNKVSNSSSPNHQAESVPKEKLNPRLIPNDPVGHRKRALFVKHLHSEMTKQNTAVAESKTLSNKHLLQLSEQELIKMALDEEENLARTQGQLYENKVKQRIAAYSKKMGMEEWLSHVMTTIIEPRNPKAAGGDRDEKAIETGLRSDEEALILPHLVADQSKLTNHGYIPIPPSEAEAAAARAGVEASKNYEECDRCGSRFQVFPERNDEGLLTSHGPCRFHPNRKVFPQKTKTDYNAAAKEPYYPCCNAVLGSAGCTTHENHVFKTSAPARLAAVLPFINTPENLNPARDKDGKPVQAVTFDCEMGYTTCGLELIRLTAISWPNGGELVDILVRPIGTIIDLNSRFSGVFPEHFANAIPYDRWIEISPQPTNALPVVSSPADARSLLRAHLTPTTPLLGHAIDNDLNTTRLCHPTIVDTVLLFPHPRGLPMRFGLKALTIKHLGRKIQQGGDQGHDSMEDARATGDLVRVKVAEKWGAMRRAGWVVGADGKLAAITGSKGWKISGDDMGLKIPRGPRGSGGRGKRKRGLGLDGAADESGSEEDGSTEEDKRSTDDEKGGWGVASLEY